MIAKEIILKSDALNNESIRPMIVQKACTYDSVIELILDNKCVNAKSIMGVMALPFEEGMEITIKADGSDEASAIDGMSELLG